ncbi:MAG TPA: protein kinase [Anaerolineales bacterium]|nr:protein kinase [Anaerolineales bacterium]
MLGLIGKTFSHYHILDQIGQGGMSSVFRAVDLKDQRAVAVKVLSPYIAAEPRFQARFQREIKLLHRMQHPNIMPILDFGEVDGLAYIVMPYIGSGTLQERLARGPLDPKEGARIVAQLAAALDCAHQNGVIHRDVKPSNVLLDPMGNALLSDFSFAHQTDASQNLTGSALVGTPAFMAPEQCRGDPIDARSDQYALSVVLYQMTTGKLPFEGDTPMAVAMKHVNEPLPRPTVVNPSLPPEIEMVLVRGLAKDPNLRYGSVLELNAAFQQATEIALHPTRRTRTRDFHRTQQIYDKYQNVKPPAQRRWFGRSAVLAAVLLLVACPASAAGIASFYPGLIGGNRAPIDIQATVNVLLTANAPGEGTYVAPGALETAIYLAVVQTLAATGAPLDPAVEAIAEAIATQGTPTPFALGLVFPTAAPTSTDAGTSGGEEPAEPSVAPTATRTPAVTLASSATDAGSTPAASDTPVATSAGTTGSPMSDTPGAPTTPAPSPSQAPTSTIPAPASNTPPPPASNTPPPPPSTNTPAPPAATRTPQGPPPSHTPKPPDPTKTPKPPTDIPPGQCGKGGNPPCTPVPEG